MSNVNDVYNAHPARGDSERVTVRISQQRYEYDSADSSFKSIKMGIDKDTSSIIEIMMNPTCCISPST